MQVSFTIPYTASALLAMAHALTSMAQDIIGVPENVTQPVSDFVKEQAVPTPEALPSLVKEHLVPPDSAFQPVPVVHREEIVQQMPSQAQVPIAPVAPPPPPAPAPAPPAPEQAEEGDVDSAGVSLDSEGLPWDNRIHSSSKALLAKGGQWKVKRGTHPNYVEEVKAELRQLMGARITPAPAIRLTSEYVTPAAAPVPPAPTPLPWGGELPPAPVAPVAPAAPAALAPAPVAVGSITTFRQFTDAVLRQKIDIALVHAKCNEFGVASLPLLNVRPELIPQIATALGLVAA